MLAMGKSEPDGIQEREKAEGRSPFPLVNAYSKEYLNLTPAFKELDFPLHVPSNVISCGPIHRKRTPLSTSDPELEEWPTKPTVLISLGSHVRLPESVAIQMARGVRAVIIARSELKVLWKLKYDSDGSGRLQEVLGSFIAAGSVKVVTWIKADIMSILETGRIATYVTEEPTLTSRRASTYPSPWPEEGSALLTVPSQSWCSSSCATTMA